MGKKKNFSREQIKDIALDYLKDDTNYKMLCTKYEISCTTFYKTLKKAVIEHIVDLKTAQDIKYKLEKNSLKHFGDYVYNMSHNRSFISLFERDTFMFKEKKCVQIITEYISKPPTLSKKKFCDLQYIDIELLDKILLNVTINKYISDTLYETLKKNSIYKKQDKCSKMSAVCFFNLIDNLREQELKVDIFKLYDYINLNGCDFNLSCIENPPFIITE